MHYGAVACFSCRAFFRRSQGSAAHRGGAAACKGGGRCAVTVDTRRFCGPCRYTACLRAGMRPGAVLTDDEKKHRFRKMFRKRREKRTKEEEDQTDSEERRKRQRMQEGGGTEQVRIIECRSAGVDFN